MNIKSILKLMLGSMEHTAYHGFGVHVPEYTCTYIW